MKRSVRMLVSVAAAVAALGATLGTVLVAAPSARAAQAAIPAQSEIRVVSWNICGEAGGSRGGVGYCPYRDEPVAKIDEVKKAVDERRANVVMLQEVCGGAPGSHMALLQERLGSEWSIRHAKGARPDGRTDCRAGLAGELGILLAVKGTVTASWAENTLPDSPADDQTLAALCVVVEGWSTTPCTTHIIPGDASRAAEQIKNVKTFVDAHAPGGSVLGGDFNRNAGAAEMAPLTSAYDSCIDGYTYHGWDTAAGVHTWHKLDHLFTTKAVGASRFASCAIDSARMDTTPNTPTSGPPSGVSDHAPVTAVLRGAPTTGDLSGDGKSDLVAVDDAGRLRLYAGLGNGSVTGGPTVIGSGGWAGASVSHRGDWTGNGTEDLLARVGGELRVYPNRGDGTLASPVRIGTGFPADSQVAGVGDATGDGYPDVIATIGDTLWLYAGDPAANPGVKPGVQIGLRGWSPMSLSAAGDTDHDGRVDLFARDANDEKLWLYRGHGDGTFGERTEYGHGYGTGNRPLLAGAGDADGNGVADLWATTNEGTGTLMFYAGETNGAGDPVDGTRTTVGSSGWNTIRAIG
ncbi:FG-GAP-like repeat-containing protein [Streptomyces sp. H27-H1]|uniref:FG-GAP-like repeat-containing protein n=1 Tax=Streptomyces sp. H27-H1 TaxID=2996461 RepID=UPI00227039A2|nr:FG-GAP-like repeat-containing protein [Streptomyces sp. H27-H1]MCY0929226.1 FG-GAP-like repeat-containing protein [Streptomyces sp. H27-H1]